MLKRQRIASQVLELPMIDLRTCGGSWQNIDADVVFGLRIRPAPGAAATVPLNGNFRNTVETDK